MLGDPSAVKSLAGGISPPALRMLYLLFTAKGGGPMGYPDFGKEPDREGGGGGPSDGGWGYIGANSVVGRSDGGAP